MTVRRMGTMSEGLFVPSSEGGIHHRQGESPFGSISANQVSGDRVAVNLLGDGYIEAINSRIIENTALREREELGIPGLAFRAPVLEAGGVATQNARWAVSAGRASTAV